MAWVVSLTPKDSCMKAAKQKTRSAQRGYSLAEVLASVGIAALVFLALGAMIAQTTRSQRLLAAKEVLSSLALELQDSFRNETSCMNRIGAQEVLFSGGDAYVAPLNITISGTSTFLQGQTIGALVIDSVRFDAIRSDASVAVAEISGQVLDYGVVTIRGRMHDPIGLTNFQVDETIPLVIQRNSIPPRTIVSCRSAGADSNRPILLPTCSQSSPKQILKYDSSARRWECS